MATNFPRSCQTFGLVRIMSSLMLQGSRERKSDHRTNAEVLNKLKGLLVDELINVEDIFNIQESFANEGFISTKEIPTRGRSQSGGSSMSRLGRILLSNGWIN
ncbi:hypothetical protein Lal_00026632 [Lupinus albus]|nr:hypothetical protein Lal_00026632 [Lupinus albus]